MKLRGRNLKYAINIRKEAHRRVDNIKYPISYYIQKEIPDKCWERLRGACIAIDLNMSGLL